MLLFRLKVAELHNRFTCVDCIAISEIFLISIIMSSALPGNKLLLLVC